MCYPSIVPVEWVTIIILSSSLPAVVAAQYTYDKSFFLQFNYINYHNDQNKRIFSSFLEVKISYEIILRLDSGCIYKFTF